MNDRRVLIAGDELGTALLKAMLELRMHDYVPLHRPKLPAQPLPLPDPQIEHKQGDREKARRLRQIERGIIRP